LLYFYLFRIYFHSNDEIFNYNPNLFYGILSSHFEDVLYFLIVVFRNFTYEKNDL